MSCTPSIELQQGRCNGFEPVYGAAMVFSLVIAGQTITALILDSTGAFGIPQISLSPSRVLGAALLLTGVILIRK